MSSSRGCPAYSPAPSCLQGAPDVARLLPRGEQGQPEEGAAEQPAGGGTGSTGGGAAAADPALPDAAGSRPASGPGEEPATAGPVAAAAVTAAAAATAGGGLEEEDRQRLRAGIAQVRCTSQVPIPRALLGRHGTVWPSFGLRNSSVAAVNNAENSVSDPALPLAGLPDGGAPRPAAA